MANRKHRRREEENNNPQLPETEETAGLSPEEAEAVAEAAGVETLEAVKEETAAEAVAEEHLPHEAHVSDGEEHSAEETLPELPAQAPAEDTDVPERPDIPSEAHVFDEDEAAVSHAEDEVPAEEDAPPAVKEQPAAPEKPSKLDAVKDTLKKKAAAAKKASGGKDDEYDPNEDYIFFKPHKKRKKTRRKKSRKLSCALVLLTFIIASGTVLAIAILTVAMEIYGISKDVSERVITIPQGSTTAAIAEQLEDEKMISLPQLFRLISRLNDSDGSYIAGEHVLSPSMSYQTMIKELCTNHADEREYVTVTFREGITLLDAAELLEKSEVCSADDFIFYFNAGGFGFQFENYLPETNMLKFEQREGYCFPDTYDFYLDEDPQIVAQKIYANFDSKLTAGEYAKMDELGMTLDEVITLASIVQAEAANEEEMRMIAGIFHNRLINRAVFDKLQSDPTKKYAEEVIHPNLPIRNQQMEDAYNTYVGAGLPPGAINNPGKAAIDAVLYPEESSYYYFYANIDTKVTYYAETYEEHLANIEKVRQEQAEAAAAAEGN